MGKLHDIQAPLPLDYKTDVMMNNRLLNTVRDADQCRLACRKPAETVQKVLPDLHFSLPLLKSSSSPLSVSTAVHTTDRRYLSAENWPQNFRKKAWFVCDHYKLFEKTIAFGSSRPKLLMHLKITTILTPSLPMP